MQEEKQCPNCKSYYTKSDLQKYRLTVLVTCAILLGACIIGANTSSDSVGVYAFLSIIFFAVVIVYAFKYFYVKVQFGHCKACNHKWSYD